MSSTALGFLIALGAAACYETSYAVQVLEARALDPRHALRSSLLGRLVRRPRWIAAAVLALAGWALQIVALGLAPLTLVQPTLALGLMLLLYLGVRFLGERVGPREVAAVVAITVGVAVIGLAAPQRVDSPAQGLGLGLAVGALALVTLAPYALRTFSGAGGWRLVLSAGSGDALAAFAAKLVSDELSRGRWLAAVGWGVAAGAGVLFALTSEMSALQRLPATRVAPVVLVMQIVIPVLLAPLLVGENWGRTPLGGGVIVAGFVLVAAGTAALAASSAVGEVLAAERAAKAHERPTGGRTS